MSDSTQSPPLAPALPIGMQLLPSASIRFSLASVPERDRAGLYREFFGRSRFPLDIEPMRGRPFEAEFTMRALPGLHLFSGRVHGSRNSRTRELMADGVDDLALMVNLGGPYHVCQNDQELVL